MNEQENNNNNKYEPYLTQNIPQQPEKIFSPLPFIGFGLGILAICLCKITVLSILLAVGGFVVSIIGGKRKFKLYGFGIAGIPLGAVALIIAIAVGASTTSNSGNDKETQSTTSSTESASSVTDSSDSASADGSEATVSTDTTSNDTSETTISTDTPSGDISEEQDYKNACTTVDYKDVLRNPSQYKNTPVFLEGEVIQVVESTFFGITTTTLRIAEKGDSDTIWYVTYSPSEGEARILEDDYVSVYGDCNGIESYTSILGGQVTVPSLEARYIVQGKIVDGVAVIFDAETIAKELEIAEYKYKSDWCNYHFLVVKNTSVYTIDLSADFKFYNANNELTGAEDTSEYNIAPGYTAILYVMPDEDYDHAEYTLTPASTSYSTPAQEMLSYEVTEQSEKLIVTLKNNGTETIRFPSVEVLFFKNGQVSGHASEYFTDDDYELKAGKEKTNELNCFDTFDSYILTISASDY